MSVRDFVRTAPRPPDWLQKAWAGAKQRGLEVVTFREIDAEINAQRCENKKTAVVRGPRRSARSSTPMFWSPVFFSHLATRRWLPSPFIRTCCVLVCRRRSSDGYAAVLARPKFAFPPDEIEALIAMLGRNGELFQAEQSQKIKTAALALRVHHDSQEETGIAS